MCILKQTANIGMPFVFNTSNLVFHAVVAMKYSNKIQRW